MGSDVPLIRLSNVVFRYGPDRPVFEGLAFEFRAGERLGLTGPNGSGKTTLLHLCVGLLKPQAGEVEIFGRQRRTEKHFFDVRCRMGLVFQDPDDQLFCPTVAEDLAFGPLNLGKTRQEAQAIAEATLSQLGMEAFANRVTTRLSFGEKKMIALAAVLAMAPEALLLDEPVASLDEQGEERITRLLAGLNVPLIAVSHDLRFLQAVTDRQLCLQDGKVAPGA